MFRPTIKHKLPLVYVVLLFLFTSTARANEWTYTIQEGDNLWDIAESFLIDMRYWRKLQQHNNITEPQSMRPGTTLQIPINWSVVKPATALITQLNGNVVYQSAAEPIPAAVELGQRLEVGDTLITKQAASVTLKFPDSSTLILRENSELVIDTLETYGEENGFNTQLKLQRGRTENHANPEHKGGARFEIHTPSATAAVRGTVYRVNAEADSTASEVLDGRVQIANALGEQKVPGGYGTRTEKDKPPTPPVVLLAAPDLQNVPTLFERLPIRHKLSHPAGASAYRVQVADDLAFQHLVADHVSPNGVAIGDIPDGDYQLRVRAIDDHGLEGSDGLSQFTLNARPEPPIVIAPRMDAVMPPEFTQLQWTGRDDIAEYHLEVADNAQFVNPIIKDNVSKAEWPLEKPLEAGDWYWRLTAISAEEGAGPVGDTIHFQVMNAGPEMTAPALDDTQIALHWSASLPDDQYQIQIANDDAFSDIIVDETLTASEYTLALPEAGSTIYVRTKILASDGLQGSWSTPQKIDVPVEPPYWLLSFAPFLLLLL